LNKEQNVNSILTGNTEANKKVRGRMDKIRLTRGFEELPFNRHIAIVGDIGKAITSQLG